MSNPSKLKKRSKEDKIIKPQRVIRISTDIWNHIYGLLTLLSFVTAVISTYFTIKIQLTGDTKLVLYSLVGIVISFMIMFVFYTIYYQRKFKQFNDLPAQHEILKVEYENEVVANQQIAECTHNITHYYRNMLARIDGFLQNKQNYSKDDIEELIDRFDSFLINATTNLELYFSIATEDNCSITIKLLNKDGLVKTYFRDPVNHKKRKMSDGSDSGLCHFSENTALDIILDPNHMNVHFAYDNLMELYNQHLYVNPNPNWHLLYNSTLVVPISMIIGENDRDTIGFVSVDNFKGGLSYKPHREYLFFIGDLFYNIFVKFSEVVKFAQFKQIDNEKIRRFSNWYKS